MLSLDTLTGLIIWRLCGIGVPLVPCVLVSEVGVLLLVRLASLLKNDPCPPCFLIKRDILANISRLNKIYTHGSKI